uniref:DNA-directed RNA polymerase n=1 Tax=Spongospora subterranea TaxID=70186 RepID=A0A0H5QR92_9EUKA|eukprot:CRZ04563.1 hypothetical protein [Spongospora subterranea]
MPLSSKRLLIMSLVDRVQSLVLVRSTPSITKCYVTTRSVPGQKEDINIVQTDGVNFHAIWAYAHLVDVNQIKTNDIAAILQTYGVECARAAIVKEITSVFAVYGISVR